MLGEIGSRDRAEEIAEFEMHSLLMELTANYPKLSRDEIKEIIRNEANCL